MRALATVSLLALGAGVSTCRQEPTCPRPVDAARSALERSSAAREAGAADLEAARPVYTRRLRGGAELVRFEQRVAGIEVYPGAPAVLLRADRSAAAVTGTLQRTAGAELDFSRSAEEVLAAVLSGHFGVAVEPAMLLDAGESGEWRRFAISPEAPLLFSQPARVKRILHAEAAPLRAAYMLELFAAPKDGGDEEVFRYIASARDARVLSQRDLTHHAFGYRVFAEIAGDLRPLDGPHTDVSPHPTGVPDGTEPSPIPPVLLTVAGRDPWLPAGALETAGNNADAYADHNPPDGYSNGDLRAVVTGDDTFDRTYDPNLEPYASPGQTMAAVTQLFYTINWLHDWWYESGFDELAGNAQRDNYGRGGIGGDPIRAEVQDSYLLGSHNNYNMSVPADGASPRMQMYVWLGRDTAWLELTPGGRVAVGTATFGARDFNVVGAVQRINDGVGDTDDGCSPFAASGRVALIRRGGCTFTVKVAHAQAAGAIGAIIVNNVAYPTPPTLGGTDATITIPALSVTQADGAAIYSALQSGPVSARMFRDLAPSHDGALDNTLVAHEWAHYLVHRLSDCASEQCRALSEGWADFIALHLVLREGDDLDGAYAHAVYAARADQNAAYFGLRRAPYSADPAKNALRFRHITDDEPLPATAPIRATGRNSDAHNAGEIWASMLFDAYVALHRDAASSGSASFEEVRRRMGDYVVAALQLAPRDATFTEARDAVLAAVAAIHAEDLPIIATAFAGRGAGTCAVSPARDSDTFAGVVESAEIGPRISLGTITVDDSLHSCDGDGVLDGEERGRLRISVWNTGPVPLEGAAITVTATTAGAVLRPASTILAGVAPFSAEEVELELELPALAGVERLLLGIRVESPAACATATSSVALRVNVDEASGARRDDVEAENTAWTRSGVDAESAWLREETAPFEHVWRGHGLPGVSDTRLESPLLAVSSSEPFVFAFDHRHAFEGDGVFFDGAVIEVSTDGGAGWADLSTYLDPGYGGVITDTSGNPLATRPAFVGNNAAWPAQEHVRFDLGTQLAGGSVKIRFRVGTDSAIHSFGWEIDRLVFSGIDNAPFTQLVPDASDCPIALVAEAGPDQTAEPGAIVVLDGASSHSATGLPLQYAWAQRAGPVVVLRPIGASAVAFTAPALEGGAALAFELTVSDGTSTAADAVAVTVGPIPARTVTANAGADQTVDPGDTVVLDGSASRSSADLPLSYTWTQVEGDAVALSAPAGVAVTFSAPGPERTVGFELTVSDGTRSATDRVQVTTRPVVVLADAGADQRATEHAVVVLDATRSTASGHPMFTWTQLAGTPVQLSHPASAVTTFIAPEVASTLELRFQVAVAASETTDTDEVTVTIEPVPPAQEAGGCTCTSPRGAAAPFGLLALGLLAGLRIIRRCSRAVPE